MPASRTKYHLIIAMALCYTTSSYAQFAPVDTVANPVKIIPKVADFVIGNIIITDNNRTKPYIIERELPFQQGDSVYLPELVQKFEIARQQLVNTRLFVEAVVALKSFRGYFVDIIIDVKERWYLFPLPYLKPIDRNLSEWARQGFGADRLNYGFKFLQYNFTGRNDKLRFWLITGYTKQIQFQYDQPYADKTLKHGYKVGFSFSSNKEINYATINDQQRFTDTFSGIKKVYAFAEYNYRPGLRTFHSLHIGFTHQQIDSNILRVNPKYYKDGKNKMDLPEISYSVNHYNVDYIPFPLTGWLGEGSILKRGIRPNTEMWQLALKYIRAVPLGRKLYFNWQAQGTIRYPFDQPFYNSQLFGYGDLYLRGLERYVIDGVAGIMARHTLRKEVLKFSVPTQLKSSSHSRIPFTIYAKTYTDIGFSYNKTFKDNSLANRMMYTAGLGLDVVTFYDFIFRLDYSFNQLGQKGLFLHLKNEF